MATTKTRLTPTTAAGHASTSVGFHTANDHAAIGRLKLWMVDQFNYTFENFFHPLVGELIQKLNQTSVAGMLDPGFLDRLRTDFFTTDYSLIPSDSIQVNYSPKKIDLDVGGPYANYNWELLYHIPVAVAVHLSKTQRFAEAQRWFHLVFDPTSTDPIAGAARYWKFLGFRQPSGINDIANLLVLLSTPDTELTASQVSVKQQLLAGYEGSLSVPFQPHLVARTRPIAYQYYVVMKYLDNLIAWGDSLFANPTIETVNEATLCYVLAANLLGPRPQQLPARGTTAALSFAQLKQAAALGKLDPMGNALVELEAQFPFNFAEPAPAGPPQGGPLFGVGRTLYFCVPENPTLLRYWDVVADRLFKIRHCLNLQGLPQPLPLFDPPLDPGMLVKAAAAGIDVGSIVSGLNQPIGPVRCQVRIQKALELCGEVRSFGTALLSAFEKGDAEVLAQLRQTHEIALNKMTQNERFLQWKQAQQATEGLLRTRTSALERYRYYLSLLGLTPDATAPDTLPLDRRELTEDNFDDAHAALVGQYDQAVTLAPYPQLRLAEGQSPAGQSGAAGAGQLFLSVSENAELNQYLPTARDTQLASSAATTIASVLTFIPEINVNLHFWGLGASSKLFGGSKLSDAIKIAGEILLMVSQWEKSQGEMAGRKAAHERRASDWFLQANLAARELRQIGLQIIGSLIAEQVAYHEYTAAQSQVSQAQDLMTFLSGEAVAMDGSKVTKFSTADLYGWMQGELSRLYYQYYRSALDAARKAEQTMKRELMRPELDATSFVQPNYWDSGHQGLLSGEALYLDLKRMELAYLDNNKRELELTAHVSLRQLDPLALLSLKVTGSCSITIPEAFHNRYCPSHYLRRLKSVSLSIPSVVGPYTNVNCTLTLQRSTVRVSPLLNNGTYGRDPANPDDRLVDYFGSVESVVTSGGMNDSGMFETNLRDDRFLPFEGAGAESTWMLSLPTPLRPFDYATIADVILHLRYTARDGGEDLGKHATQELHDQLATANQAGLALLFSLRYDFPTEWSAFVNGAAPYTFTLRKDYFPFMVQGLDLAMDGLQLYRASGSTLAQTSQPVPGNLASDLNGASTSSTLTFPADATILNRDPQSEVFLLVSYHLA